MQFFFKRFTALLKAHIKQASWQLLFVMTALHMCIVWMLLYLANEQALLDLGTYVYYYVVTTSTVGYGDYSVGSNFGRWVVSVVQIPFGLALFGLVLGKVGQLVTYWIRRSMTGEKDFYHFENHIVIFGWHDNRTKKMVDYILADKKRINRRVLLAVVDHIEHPLANYSEVDFVKLTSFTDTQQLSRIAIAAADKIIVDTQDDDQNFTTALKVSALVKKDAHITAHFLDESKARLLTEHCANVECSSSKAAEILVRAMQDPGSSRVQEEILSTLHGDTQYSLKLPVDISSTQFGKLFIYFKEQHQAILLGVAHDINAQNMDLNPAMEYAVNGGDILHYIAPQRVLAHEVSWGKV